jgi:hypothetical protein
MKQMTRQDVQKLASGFTTIRGRTTEDLLAVKALYSRFDPDVDGRITFVSRLLAVFDSARLTLMFIYKHLMNKSWWEANTTPAMPDSTITSYVHNLSQSSRMTLIHFMFSSLENSFRLLLRALDPSACNNGTAEFKSIYECLLKSKLTQCPSGSIDLLDLLRRIRNTVHNNGVYFHGTGQDASVTWRGTTDEFRHGFPVDFVSWDFSVEVADSVRILVRTVVEDSNLQAVNGQITDSFSYHTRNEFAGLEP